jgi:hypothetical protein
MIVPFMDSVAGTAVYINPAYVVILRPDPADPHRITMVKLSDGESIRVQGEHQEVADKLTRTPLGRRERFSMSQAAARGRRWEAACCVVP